MQTLGFPLPLTNPVQVFALVMLVILVALLLQARLRIPGLISLILAGVILGPHALGVLERGQTMQLLGTVGLLYIMFTAGLEFDLHEFDKHRHRSLLFGGITFAFPMGVGTLVARVLLGFDWLAAILLGSVFASHTLLAYPIVSRLGIARSEVVTTAVGATILTDTAALLVLAIVAGASQGGLSLLFLMRLVGLLSLFVFVVLWGLPRLGRWFYRRMSGEGAAEFIFILAAVFVCAVLAEGIGLEAIIGAFLAGLALNRLVPEHSALMNRIQFVGDALFIPFFLIATGMLVDLPALFSDPRSWLVAVLMVSTVLLTKGLAAWSTKLLFRYSFDERQVVFGLTVPQAAATLAAVLIGYRLGLFGTPVLNGTLLMILVTCLLGPWLADRYGRRVALREALRPYDPSAVPQRILIPLANPSSVTSLMDVALLVRDGRQDQPLYPVTIARDGPDALEEVAASEKVLAHALLHAASAAVPVQPLIRVEMNVARGLQRAVMEARISLVVMGWNDVPAATRFVFGSISDQLLHVRRVQLLLCRMVQPVPSAERVLLAVPPLAHREPGFSAALRSIKMLCRQAGTHLVLMAEARQLPVVLEAVRLVKPDVPLATHALPDWEDVLPSLRNRLGPADVLMLISARRGSVSWQAGLERLPWALVQHFGSANLIIVYPPEEGEALETNALPEGKPEAPLRLTADHVVLDLSPAPLDAILRCLLQPGFAARPEALSRAVQALGSVDYAPEVLPGAAFYHAHLPEADETLFCLGISRSGLALPHARHPVYVVLTLLTPDQTPSGVHLHHLRLVAQRVCEAETITLLRRAASIDEVLDVVQRPLQERRPA